MGTKISFVFKGQKTELLSPKSIRSFDTEKEAVEFAEKLKKEGTAYAEVFRNDYPNMRYFTVEMFDLPLTGSVFICTLPCKFQSVIRNAVAEFGSNGYEVDIDEVMSGRLVDLEDNINWREILSPFITTNNIKA